MPRKKRSGSPFELMDDDFDDTSSQSSRNGNPPIQRNAANARERARMRVLSSAFGRLKTKLPNIPADTKLSKLDTLRLATMYIKQLKAVVEGETETTKIIGESMEGSLINNNNNNNSHKINTTNCYLNLNMGVQSMNWPFGFHHHLSHSPLIRSASTTSLINNISSHNNWRPTNNSEETIKHAFYDVEDYDQHHRHHNHQQQQPSSFMNQQNNQSTNHQWYSETPSPELDTRSSDCLNFENSYLQHKPEHQHHEQQQQNSSHHHYRNLAHAQPASTHSSTFQLQHNFHHHTQCQPSTAHQLHHNGFINATNFQSTSIR